MIIKTSCVFLRTKGRSGFVFEILLLPNDDFLFVRNTGRRNEAISCAVIAVTGGKLCLSSLAALPTMALSALSPFISNSINSHSGVFSASYFVLH